jgi:hypothetical protein
MFLKVGIIDLKMLLFRQIIKTIIGITPEIIPNELKIIISFEIFNFRLSSNNEYIKMKWLILKIK